MPVNSPQHLIVTQISLRQAELEYKLCLYLAVSDVVLININGGRTVLQDQQRLRHLLILGVWMADQILKILNN